jgi:DNA-binding CsgD family transcriptional regulator
MYLFERLLRALERAFRGRPRSSPVEPFNLDVDTLRSLEWMAEREKSTPGDIATQILGSALRGHLAQEELWRRWQSLSPREQEIAALVCLNYTGRQVASRLHISPQTVKTHVERILLKFDVSDRGALRKMLSGWDFSAWDR